MPVSDHAADPSATNELSVTLYNLVVCPSTPTAGADHSINQPPTSKINSLALAPFEPFPNITILSPSTTSVLRTLVTHPPAVNAPPSVHDACCSSSIAYSLICDPVSTTPVDTLTHWLLGLAVLSSI